MSGINNIQEGGGGPIPGFPLSSHTMETVMEKKEMFYRLFKGRTDQMGVADEMSIPVTGEDEIRVKVQEHLEGKRRCGFYVPLPDLTTSWAMIEFEDHGKPGDVKDPEQKSLDFIEHMNSVGINVHRELSKNPSGKCYHLWIFFDKPMLAKTVRSAFNTFLNNVMYVTTEVFPKNDGGTNQGHFVWLPLFDGTDKWGEGVSQGRTIFIDGSGNPHPDQWGYLETVARTNEFAIEKMVSEYKLEPSIALRSKKGLRLDTTDILVDGLQKVRECKFMLYCEQNASSLPERFWYAWITNAARCIGGWRTFTNTVLKTPAMIESSSIKKSLMRLPILVR